MKTLKTLTEMQADEVTRIEKLKTLKKGDRVHRFNDYSPTAEFIRVYYSEIDKEQKVTLESPPDTPDAAYSIGLSDFLTNYSLGEQVNIRTLQDKINSDTGLKIEVVGNEFIIKVKVDYCGTVVFNKGQLPRSNANYK